MLPQGLIAEFKEAPATSGDSPSLPPLGSSWLLVNGLFALLLSSGLLLTSLLVLGARCWRLLRGWARGLLADYGVALLVVVWSGMSFALKGAQEGVPRRLSTPNTWQVRLRVGTISHVGWIFCEITENPPCH